MKKIYSLIVMFVLLAIPSAMQAQTTTVTIGDTNHLTRLAPYATNFNYSFVESIYTADEIGIPSGGFISSISFHAASDVTHTEHFTIYLKNVTRSSFSFKKDYEPLNDAIMVYEGDYTISQGWNIIPLNAPFFYSGTHNLMVAIHENAPDKCTGMNSLYFHAALRNNSINRYFDDTQDPDPFNLDLFSKQSANNEDRAMIQIVIEPEDPSVNNDTINFETNDFSQFPFVQDATYPWIIVNGTTVNSCDNCNTYCMRSGNAGVHNSVSTIEATYNFYTPGHISFDAQCMGEGTGTLFDHCDFFIDGEQQFSHGEDLSGWNHYSFNVNQGTHTFKWSYRKDASGNNSGDGFYVDNIMFWPTTTIQCPAPNNLAVSNFAPDKIDLTWNQLGGGTEWDIQYSTNCIFNPTLETSSNSTSKQLTGLDANTTYYVRIRSICNATEVSPWSETMSFTTTGGYTGISNIVDFETGDFSQFQFIPETDHQWYVVGDVAGGCTNESEYCMRSSYVGAYQSSSISARYNFTSNGKVSFDAECRGGLSGYEHCYFYIDDVLQFTESFSNWNHYSFDVPAGIHTLRWTFTKSASNGDGSEAFLVDNIVIVPSNYVSGEPLVEIGSNESQNTHLPTHAFYKYSISEQIYTATEIGQAGNIYNIAFYNTSDEATRNINLYLVHTNKDVFAGNADWIPVTAADLVFSGDVEFLWNEWTVIEFPIPFAYNGTDNLLVVVDDNTGDWIESRYFQVFGAQSQSLYSYSDNINFDPAGPSNSVFLGNMKNHILLGFTPIQCPKPTDLTISNLTKHTATIAWTDNSGATSWEICLNGDEASPIPVTTNPYTLSGLSGGTDNSVRVRALCGSDEVSLWSVEQTFTTPVSCSTPTIYVDEVGSDFATLHWDANDATSWDLLFGIGGAAEYYGTVTTNSHTFTGLTPNTNYFFVMEAICGDEGRSQVATVHFTTLPGLPPTCQAPTNLAVSNISDNGADITWNQPGGGDLWWVQYSTDAVFSSYILQEVNETSLSLTNLTLGNTYYVRIANICSDTDLSPWSETLTVSTTGINADIINFETNDFSQHQFVQDATYPWIIVDASNGCDNGSAHCMRSGNVGVHNTSSSIEATYNFTNNGYISFDAKCMGEESDYDVCKFFIDGTQQFSKDVSNWSHYTFPVSSGSHTFKWTFSKDVSVNGTGDAFFVDNIEFINSSTCLPPTNLAVSTRFDGSAIVSWNGQSDSYTLRYRLEGSSLWNTITDIQNLNYTISGLAPNNYEVAVSSSCNPNLWTPATFTIIPILSTANWYCYNKYSWTTELRGLSRRFIRFQMQDPSNVTAASDVVQASSAAYTDAVAYADGYVWCITADHDLTRATFDHATQTISTFETVVSGFESSSVNSMSFNPTNGRIYYLTSDCYLKSFNPSAPNDITTIGYYPQFSPMLLAINAAGEGYFIDDIYEVLYRVHLNNGLTSYRGETGHAFSEESMAFDLETGELFWIQYNGVIYWVNTETGETKFLGYLGDSNGFSNAAFTGLFSIPSSTVPVCSAPTDFSVSNVGSNGAGVSWSQPGGGELWMVQYSTNADFSNANEETIGSTEWYLYNLEPGTHYYIHIAQVCGSSMSSWSETEEFTTTGSSCVTPTSLSVSNVSYNSADLSWSQPGGGNDWQIEYSTDPDFSSSEFVGADATSFSLTNLDPITTYYVRVRHFCGTMGTSSWSNVVSFTTTGGIIIVSDFIDFETGDFSQHPFGQDADYPWIIVDNTVENGCDNGSTYCMRSGNAGVASSTSTIEATHDYSEDGYITFDAKCMGEATNYDVCKFYIDGEQQFSHAILDWDNYIYAVPAGSHTFTWSYTKDNSVNKPGDGFFVDNIEFGLNSTLPCPGPTNLTVSNVGSNGAGVSWEQPGSGELWMVQYSTNADFSNANEETVGGTSWYLYSLEPNTHYYIHVAQVCGSSLSSWSETEEFTTTGTPCVAPNGLTFSNVSYNGADLTWSQPGGGNDWQIEYSTDPDFTSSEFVGADATSFSLTNLDPITTYYVRVRQFCGTMAPSDWSNTVSFTTTGCIITCLAPTDLTVSDVGSNDADLDWTGFGGTYTVRYRANSTLFSDGFENGLGQWTQLDADGDSRVWILGSDHPVSFSAHEGSDIACSQSWIQNIGALTPNNYLVTPQVTLGGSVSFWAKALDHNYPAEHFGIAVSTSGNTDAADFTTIAEWTLDAGDWQHYTVDLSAYAGQTGYVALRHFDCYDMFVLGIDEFAIYGPDPWQTITTSTANAHLFGLAPETEYEVQVQSDCGSDGSSEWSDRFTFSTLSGSSSTCLAPTNFAVSNVGSNGAGVSWSQPGGGELWMVQYSTNADFSNANEETVGGTSWYLYSLEPNTHYYVHVAQVCGSSMSSWSETEEFTTTGSSCVTPTGLSVSNVSYNGADLSWNQPGGGNDWQIEYSTDPDFTSSEFVGAVATTFSLTNLAPITTYYVRVRQFCGTMAPSSWSNTVSFITTGNHIVPTYLTIEGETSVCHNERTTLTATSDVAGTYRWSTGNEGQQIFVPAGTYSVTVTSSTGDWLADTVTVTEKETFKVTIDSAVCYNELPVVWNGITFTNSGTESFTYQATNGCDSIVTLNLIVNPIYHTALFETICEGESYDFLGQTLTQEGTYVDTLQTVNGCDSVVTLTLTVNPAYHVSDSRTVCPSALPYIWNNVTFTEADTQDVTLQTVNGCDSIVTMTVLVNTAYSVSVTNAICPGELPYTWNNVTFTEAGTQDVTLQSADGCDSIVTMTLTIIPAVQAEIAEVACEEYTWNNETFTVSGDYTQTFTNAAGCDSVVTLHLTINHNTTGDTTAVVCDSFIWHGVEYTETPTTAPTYTYQTVHGCDSVVTLNLTINHSTTGDTTAVVCDSFIWHGVEYTETPATAPTYTYQTVNGCDSVVTLNLTIIPADHAEIAEVACEEYTWDNETFTASGDYTRTFTNAVGCDSVVTLHLTINHSTTSDTTAVVCDSFIWHGVEYTETPTTAPTYTYQTVNGCDSVVTLNLTIIPADHAEIAEVACEEYTWNNETFTVSGDYTQTFTNAAGCDSVVTLHLTINHNSTGDTTAVVCDSFIWHGVEYTETPATAPTYTYQTVNGCDSVVTLNLTINHSTTGDTTAVECDSFIWHGVEYTETPATAPTYTYQTVHGCDSVVTLNLTILHGSSAVVANTICASELPYIWNGVTFNEAGMQTTTIDAANGCDSVITMVLTVNTPAHQAYTVENCDSYTWTTGNGQSYTSSGNYTYIHEDNNGCTQVDTLHLTILHGSNAVVANTICASELPYVWNGVTFNEAGTQTATIDAANGCDSVITMVLTVNPPAHQAYTVETCDSYTWITGNNQTYTTSGNYTYIHEDNNGCTQVDTLHLTILHGSSAVVANTICASELPYVWNGVTFNEAGMQTATIDAANGCDSVITMVLMVNTPAHQAYTVETCDSYTWITGNNQTYTTSGDYTYGHPDVNGCTQVDTLHLIINQSTASEFTIETSEGCYTWNGTAYCQSGNYTQYLETAAGCDSIVTLHLSVGVGIEDHEVTLLYLTPNPATNTCRIVGLDTDPVSVGIYDMSGKIVRRPNTTEFDVSTLPTGIYMVRVTTDERIVNLKMMKR